MIDKIVWWLIQAYKKIKFIIASFLDDHTSLCWGSLVMWSLGYCKFNEIERHKKGCDYCGKYSKVEE